VLRTKYVLFSVFVVKKTEVDFCEIFVRTLN